MTGRQWSHIFEVFKEINLEPIILKSESFKCGVCTQWDHFSHFLWCWVWPCDYMSVKGKWAEVHTLLLGLPLSVTWNPHVSHKLNDIDTQSKCWSYVSEVALFLSALYPSMTLWDHPPSGVDSSWCDIQSIFCCTK